MFIAGETWSRLYVHYIGAFLIYLNEYGEYEEHRSIGA